MTDLSERDLERLADRLAAKLAEPSRLLPETAPEQMSDMAKLTAQSTVHEMSGRALAFLGVDLANTTHIEQLKADLTFIRNLRVRLDRVGQSATTAVTNAITYGLIALLVVGFLLWARGESPPHHPHNIPK